MAWLIPYASLMMTWSHQLPTSVDLRFRMYIRRCHMWTRISTSRGSSNAMCSEFFSVGEPIESR